MAYLSERPLALQQQIFAKLFKAAQVAAMTEEEQEQYFAQMLTERDRVSQKAVRKLLQRVPENSRPKMSPLKLSHPARDCL